MLSTVDLSDKFVLAIHMNSVPSEMMPPPEANPSGEDALLYPNASIAALLYQAERLGVEAVAIDETFPGGDFRRVLDGLLEDALARGKTPHLMFTVLYYNAERTMRLISELRRCYGRRIRVIVGGFMARLYGEQYARNPEIDVVAVGDAEMIMAESLVTQQRMIRGVISEQNIPLGRDERRMHYGDLSYDRYVGLDERLDRMARFPVGWGSTRFTGMRQVCVESLRSCSWAVSNPKGACRFCAASLDLLQVNPRPLRAEFDLHMKLIERHGINWVFDVASQWLPTFTPSDCERWLTEYIRTMEEYPAEVRALNKYVYLTLISFSERVSPLLREAGVKMAYIGIDHVDPDVLKHMNKPAKRWDQVIERLDQCRDHDIDFRTALVIGEAESDRSLHTLVDQAKSLCERYSDSMLSLGSFLIEIIPGSRVFSDLRRDCADMPEVVEVYETYDRQGYVPREFQLRLTRAYISRYSTVSFDEVLAAQQQVVRTVSDSYKKSGYHLWFLDGPAPAEATAVGT